METFQLSRTDGKQKIKFNSEKDFTDSINEMNSL